TKSKIKNQLSVLIAGRVAEEVFVGKDNITIGAQNDIEKSTSLAIDYIAKYGMDENMGFLNAEVLSNKLNVSLTSIENSVKSLIDELYDEVMHIIMTNKDKIDAIAKLLIEKEVLYEDDLVIK
ncbi:MAG: cell division protein FtsH, partial [Tissierellia bacterium]|nr:cell division protein FtsH [Tissierellia bacterium]